MEECKEFTDSEEFVEIPDYPNYLISRNGIIFNIKLDMNMKATKLPAGYTKVVLSNENGSKNYHIHKLIAKIFIPNPDNKPLVDHINGIKDDNRVENLRWVTRAQNNSNSRKINNKSSRYRGVHKHGDNKSWAVEIRHQRESQYIGIFKTEIEAALAYDKKARELHGGYARTNFDENGVENPEITNIIVNKIKKEVKRYDPNDNIRRKNITKYPDYSIYEDGRVYSWKTFK